MGLGKRGGPPGDGLFSSSESENGSLVGWEPLSEQLAAYFSLEIGTKTSKRVRCPLLGGS